MSPIEAAPKPPPHPPRWLPDVLLSVVVVVLAFFPPPIPAFQMTGPTAVVLALLPVLVLPWRRRWPVPVLAVLAGVFGASALLGTLLLGIGIAVGAAAFQVAFQSSRRRAFTIGAVAAVVMVVLALLAQDGAVFDPRVFQFGLIVAFATAAGDGARSRREFVDAITERAERAERSREAEARRQVSEERLRIARDLHDAVAHQIAVISLNAGAASAAIDTRPDAAKESLVVVRDAARSVLGEIGDLMVMLRADDTDAATTSPQPGIERLDELVAQFAGTGLDVHVRVEGDPLQVSGAASMVGYRVVQEALTNAHKHGAEHRAHVLIRVDDELTVTVTNPMNPAGSDTMNSSGLGLLGLRERVASVRGTVEAGPAPAGWKVTARLPLTQEKHP